MKYSLYDAINNILRNIDQRRSRKKFRTGVSVERKILNISPR